jgi:hypothetical protein
MNESTYGNAAHGNPAVITVPGSASTLEELDDRDLEVGEVEAAVRPILDDARLQWFNGLATTSGKMAIGWHIRVGINPYLDETCGALAAQEGSGCERYLVQHKRPDKDGTNDPKPYWHFQRMSLFVIAEGALSPLQMSRSAERVGIAWGWSTERNEQGEAVLKNGKPSKSTVLKLKAFVHELYTSGFSEPLPLTLTGFGTDDMLSSLYEQYRVLDAYAARRRAQGKPAAAPFSAFSLPLAASSQVRMVGEPPNTSPIYPMVADIPEGIDANYLAQHLIPRPLLDEIRSKLLGETVYWSIEETNKIIHGSTAVAALNGAATETQQLSDGSNRHGDQGDPLVQPAHVTWIKEHYCYNNQAVVQALCERFHVPELSRLCTSQFRQLVEERKNDSQQ